MYIYNVHRRRAHYKTMLGTLNQLIITKFISQSIILDKSTNMRQEQSRGRDECALIPATVLLITENRNQNLPDAS